MDGGRTCLAALGAAAVTSCSLLVDTSGLAGGVHPADAAADVDVGAPADCSSTIVDSFDTGPLGANWSGLDQTGPTLSLDSTDALSPPNALLVTIPAGVGGHAYLRKSVAPAKTACCSVAQKSSVYDLALWAFVGSSGNYNVTVSADTVSESYYAGPATMGINRVVGTIPYTGQWQRVRVDAVLPPGTGRGTLQVTVDGVVALTDQIGDDSFDLSFDEIDMGVTYVDPPTSLTTARFDDVSCWLR